MADFLNIGLTGLMASQAKLNVASHNIANADTPGYSRQSAVQTTQPSQYMGYGYVGQGARVVDVERAYDQFLHKQLLQSQSQASYYQNYSDLVAPIEGTDISWMDLSLSFLWWPDAVLSGREDVKGRDCLVVDTFEPQGIAD